MAKAPPLRKIPQLDHHVTLKKRPAPHHPVSVDFALHSLTFVFDAVRA